MKEKSYLAIDLKSFFASVECSERGLNPMTTNLVVADESRTDKTICLAVTPSLKQYGIPSRCRLFEVKRKVREVNAERLRRTVHRRFSDKSYSDTELKENPSLELDFITARPRMSLYMEYSKRIYDIYMKYVSSDDVIVYSIDEVFIDVTGYLETYKLSAHELAMKMICDVLETTGITATVGIGTNLFLCKVAMDIMAKKMQPDINGVRIAELTEKSFREQLWSHMPLTDFWRIGKGYAAKLETLGLYTMGDIAMCSVEHEDILYGMFGKNAELLIDHAWGWEPCEISDIKAYKPSSNSLGAGQVLSCPYSNEKAKIVLCEMTDILMLELVDKGLLTDSITVTVGYDAENMAKGNISEKHTGEVVTDMYGRKIPKAAHGTAKLGKYVSSSKIAMNAVSELFDRITDKKLTVRRLNVTANSVLTASEAEKKKNKFEQLDLFTDYSEVEKERRAEELLLEKETKIQKAMLEIKKKYGKNSILKGLNYEDGATARERNLQIGGHKA